MSGVGWGGRRGMGLWERCRSQKPTLYSTAFPHMQVQVQVAFVGEERKGSGVMGGSGEGLSLFGQPPGKMPVGRHKPLYTHSQLEPKNSGRQHTPQRVRPPRSLEANSEALKGLIMSWKTTSKTPAAADGYGDSVAVNSDRLAPLLVKGMA